MSLRWFPTWSGGFTIRCTNQLWWLTRLATITDFLAELYIDGSAVSNVVGETLITVRYKGVLIDLHYVAVVQSLIYPLVLGIEWIVQSGQSGLLECEKPTKNRLIRPIFSRSSIWMIFILIWMIVLYLINISFEKIRHTVAHWRYIPSEGIQNYSMSHAQLLKQSIQPECSSSRREKWANICMLSRD